MWKPLLFSRSLPNSLTSYLPLGPWEAASTTAFDEASRSRARTTFSPFPISLVLIIPLSSPFSVSLFTQRSSEFPLCPSGRLCSTIQVRERKGKFWPSFIHVYYKKAINGLMSCRKCAMVRFRGLSLPLPGNSAGHAVECGCPGSSSRRGSALTVCGGEGSYRKATWSVLAEGVISTRACQLGWGFVWPPGVGLNLGSHVRLSQRQTLSVELSLESLETHFSKATYWEVNGSTSSS